MGLLGHCFASFESHFRCDETDDLDREFTVTFHPTSRYHAAVYEVSCDDSYSDTACPE